MIMALEHLMALDDFGDYETTGKPQPHPVEYDLSGADVRVRLRDMSPCCLETVAGATENLAVLARDLFAKAEDTLDEARKAAVGSQQLVEVAKAYLELAEATA